MRSKPLIQAEIKNGVFEIIDGHHRLKKAYREGVKFIDSYKLLEEQLPQYLADERGYKAYIGYWNMKLYKE